MIANKSQVIIDARASDMCFSFRSRVVVLQLCFLMLAHPPVSVDFCTSNCFLKSRGSRQPALTFARFELSFP